MIYYLRVLQLSLEPPEVQEEAKMRCARGGAVKKRQDDILFAGGVWFCGSFQRTYIHNSFLTYKFMGINHP